MRNALSEYISLGVVAKRLGCELWQVRRLFERGFLHPAHRIGAYRVVKESELPKIKAALVKVGYLKKKKAPRGKPVE
jgi:hypothetical protein